MPISIEVTLYVNAADGERFNSNIRFNGEAETVELAKVMALKLHQLSEAIGGVSEHAELKVYPNGPADGQTAKSAGKSAATEKATSSAIVDTESERPNALSQSATSESSTASAPTGESSSPALDYAKDVKPITLRLSKEKGRETTIAVLQRFGVKGAQDLEATQWAEYIAHCEKVLAGGDV